MQKVSDEVKALFKSDNVHKELVIEIPELDLTLTNEDVYAESMRVDEAIETSNNLTFVGCIASKFEIEIADLPQELHGKTLGAKLYLPDIEEPMPLFNGTIDTVTGTSHEEYSMKLTCYDALYKINNTDVTAWYNSLSFPISIKAMRDSFFNFVGVEQEADALANDYFLVDKTIEDAVINGEKIIKAICQLNGRFGRIGRNGKFQYVHLVEGTEALYPRNDLFPSEELFPHAENALDNINKAHYESINFENYRVTPIDKIQLADKEGNIIAASGNGGNVFTIKDNPLIWGKTTAVLNPIAQNLYNEIQGLWYVPTNVNCIGLPYVECGDFVLMSCRRTIVRAYVLQRTLSGIQSLKDNYQAKGDIKQPPYVVSLKQKVSANDTAIKNESNRAQSAETSERNRAQSAERDLNNSIGSVNNRVSAVYSELIDTKNLVATKASIADLQVTNNLVATKASIAQLNAVNARVDNLYSDRVTTSYLRANVVSIYGVTCTKLTLAGHDLGLTTITTGTGRTVRVVCEQ